MRKKQERGNNEKTYSSGMLTTPWLLSTARTIPIINPRISPMKKNFISITPSCAFFELNINITFFVDREKMRYRIYKCFAKKKQHLKKQKIYKPQIK
jgi:hypothetical protein